MRNYTLENYEDQLIHQVIHMDQAVCYNPEFRATLKLHDYPSRKLQLARAVYKEELPLTDYIGDIVYSSILSRQGERWQNFREDPEDCTDCFILTREMLLKKGYQAKAVEEFKAALKEGGGHLVKGEVWNLPVDADSDTAILLDDATAASFYESAGKFAAFCEKKNLAFANVAKPEFLGFEYFAYGLVEEGIAHLKSLTEKLSATGAKKVLVLSAQAKYLLTTFAGKVGITPAFEVVYLPEILDTIVPEKLSYVYGGSFNLRYLCNAELLNDLIPNSQEAFDKESAEFIPLLHGDHRANRLTIWQRPVGAEYSIYGVEDSILEAIKAEAIEDIRKSEADQIIVFEPTAYSILKEAFPDKKVVSYLDC